MRINNLLGWILTSSGYVFGILNNVLANWLGAAMETNPIIIKIFFAAVGIVGIVALAATYLKPRYVHVVAQMQMPRTMDTPENCENFARRGLIIFVSKFVPSRSKSTYSDPPSRWEQAADERDLVYLDFEHSNFETVIKAVTSHACRLEHCWLISTRESRCFLPALVQYLKEKKGITCQFYGNTDDKYVIDVNNSLAAGNTKEMVERIFKDAVRLYHLPETEMVADFTPCPRNMTLGLILACLDQRRTVQFIETRYDAAGAPVGPKIPYLYDFTPVVPNDN